MPTGPVLEVSAGGAGVAGVAAVGIAELSVNNDTSGGDRKGESSGQSDLNDTGHNCDRMPIIAPSKAPTPGSQVQPTINSTCQVVYKCGKIGPCDSIRSLSE